MSKTKISGPIHYEILFIIPNRFTDDEAKKVMESVKQTIIDNGGEITYDEYWGKKRLAYKIDHNIYGYYGLFEFDLERNEVIKVDTTLRLSKDILRHQIVKKKKRSEKEIKKEKELKEKLEKEDKKEEKVEKKKEENLVEKKKGGETEEKKKDNLKDLDEKLDGILNAKDLI